MTSKTLLGRRWLAFGAIGGLFGVLGSYAMLEVVFDAPAAATACVALGCLLVFGRSIPRPQAFKTFAVVLALTGAVGVFNSLFRPPLPFGLSLWLHIEKDRLMQKATNSITDITGSNSTGKCSSYDIDASRFQPGLGRIRCAEKLTVRGSGQASFSALRSVATVECVGGGQQLVFPRLKVAPNISIGPPVGEASIYTFPALIDVARFEFKLARASIEAPVLAKVGEFEIEETGATSLSLPTLAEIDELVIRGNLSLEEISLPSLHAVQRIRISGNTALRTVRAEPCDTGENSVFRNNGHVAGQQAPALSRRRAHRCGQVEETRFTVQSVYGAPLQAIERISVNDGLLYLPDGDVRFETAPIFFNEQRFASVSTTTIALPTGRVTIAFTPIPREYVRTPEMERLALGLLRHVGFTGLGGFSEVRSVSWHAGDREVTALLLSIASNAVVIATDCMVGSCAEAQAYVEQIGVETLPAPLPYE